MSEKPKSTSPSAVQVKNQRKTVGTEEKLDAIRWPEKGEWVVDMCHNVWFADVSVILLIELQKVLNQEFQCLC